MPRTSSSTVDLEPEHLGEELPANAALVTADDVLDMHELLAGFEGDMHALLGGPGRRRQTDGAERR